MACACVLDERWLTSAPCTRSLWRVQRVASSADADKACERERIALQACTRKMVRGLLACAQFAADER